MNQISWLDLLVIITGSVVLLFVAWRVIIKHQKFPTGAFLFSPFLMAFAALDLFRQLNILPGNLLMIVGVLLLICLIFYCLHTIIQIRRNDGENFKV